jgi:hypothetical protein
MDQVMSTGGITQQDDKQGLRTKRFVPFPGVDAYALLKVATEVFLMVHAGVLIDFNFETLDLDDEANRLGRAVKAPELKGLWDAYLKKVNGHHHDGKSVSTFPYLALIRRKLKDVPIDFAKDQDDLARACFGILERKLSNPYLLELLWSYWHEEAMLVQTLNAISLRFQNRRQGEWDPLAHLEIDPLRPVNNLLWGYIQDEQHRLSVMRRAYEYDHHYGLTLLGKAVPETRPADSRSRFLEAFHNLLQLCSVFFRDADITTVIPDGFPVLNGIKEVHLILSEGAHNQYGDLPWTARQEMLMQQWLLARPEMREFLPTRVMVAYPEAWMDRVDAMKKIQGWTDTSVLHFRDLGRFGEQILLGIRFGNWSDVNDPAQAANWARYWRPEIQGYIHAYRTVTGVDLAAESPDSRYAADRYLQPSAHLLNRLTAQRRPTAIPAPERVPQQIAAPSRDGQAQPADSRVPQARSPARIEPTRR